jgi:inosose dehydratase
MTISVASAPVSWGIMESVPFPREYPYSRVLDEIAQAGYAGTELGPYGFLPAEPMTLCKQLEQRGLALCSAFVEVSLANRGAAEAGLKDVERTAKLLREVGCHLLILSDEKTAERCALAGRCSGTQQYSYNQQQWRVAEETVREVLGLCATFGMKVAFHHHVGTHIETPEEIDHLFSLFSTEELGMCLDTGHCVYGGGDPQTVLERHIGRLRCLHFKDIDGGRLEEVRRQQLDFHAAVRRRVFAQLGRGVVDFSRLLNLVHSHEFKGWVVAEQDVLEGGSNGASPLANAMAGRSFLGQMGL